MEFDELINQVKLFSFDEVRVDKEDFFEAVIRKKDLDALNAKLVSIFGVLVWPPEKKLPNEVNDLIKNHGGVMGGQMLYFARLKNSPVFVMLWPWGDKEHITLKIGRELE